jgi:hypothetical protein
MKRITWLLFLFMMIVPATTKAQGTPPDPISVCFTPATGNWWNQCISIGDFQGERVGSLGIGYFAWHVDINAWSADHIKLTATVTHPDASGKTEVMVIEGKFDEFKQGVAHGKIHYLGAHEGKDGRKFTLTWTPKAPTGLFVN